MVCNWILRPNKGSTEFVAIYIQPYGAYRGSRCLNVGLVYKEIVGAVFIM